MFTEKRTTFISKSLLLKLKEIGFEFDNLFKIEKKS